MIETEKQTKGESDEKRNGSKTHFCIRHGDGSGDAVSFPAGESACAKDLLGGDREAFLDSAEQIVNAQELEELLKQSDIVSLHCPLTEETKGMIGEEQLKMMKKTALLINTARGAVVDSKALAKALGRRADCRGGKRCL